MKLLLFTWIVFLFSQSSNLVLGQYDQKNFLGVEVLKPAFLLVYSSTDDSKGLSSTIELAYKREINTSLFYRGTFGYATFRNIVHENDLYFVNGYFTKQGLDFRMSKEEVKLIDIILNMSICYGRFDETLKVFQNSSNSQYALFSRSDFYFAGEFAVRLALNLKNSFTIELSQRFTFTKVDRDKLFSEEYLPGVGIFRVPVGLELKLFKRF